jgi:hypothetical protein
MQHKRIKRDLTTIFRFNRIHGDSEGKPSQRFLLRIMCTLPSKHEKENRHMDLFDGFVCVNEEMAS